MSNAAKGQSDAELVDAMLKHTRPVGSAATTTPRWRRSVWFFLARALVTVATLASASAAVLALRHGDLTGLLSVGFLFMQPMLYRAMTYGL